MMAVWSKASHWHELFCHVPEVTDSNPGRVNDAFIYFTLLREQDEAYINASQWLMLVGLEPVYIRMVSRPLYLCGTAADIYDAYSIFV